MQINDVYSLLQQGKLEQAWSACDQLISKHPEESSLKLLMAAILHRQEHTHQAIELLLQVSKDLDSASPEQIKIVKALRFMGALDQASILLDQLGDKTAEVLVNRAQVAWQAGDYTAALKGFQHAAQQWPEQAEPVFALCRALLRTNQLEQAEKAIRQAQSRWPGNAELGRLAAVQRLDTGQPEAALAELVKTREQTASPESLPGRMLNALQQVLGETEVAGIGEKDAIGRGFQWVQQQPGNPEWFGTNSGLLKWAVQQIPESLPAASPLLECGVFHGFSLNLMASWTERPIHGFDSFEGLPEPWKPGEPAGSYTTSGKLPETPSHVRLHAGWFEDTLPGFAANLEMPIALLHVDCDIYSSTRTVLETLAPHLGAGSLLVFDDFLSYEGFEEHEFRAAQEYFDTKPGCYELLGAVLLGRAVVYRRTQKKTGSG